MKIIKIIRDDICMECHGTGTAVSITSDGEKEPVPCLCGCEPTFEQWLKLHGIEVE